MTVLEQLQKALDLAGNTHEMHEVGDLVAVGHAQLWATDKAILVTQLHGRSIHFWLGAGELDELIVLSRGAMKWAKEIGCHKATLAGRKGWKRALESEGWRESKLVVLEREL